VQEEEGDGKKGEGREVEGVSGMRRRIRCCVAEGEISATLGSGRARFRDR
jgi:hypothetical protein